jgi:hypothetical protein
MSRYCSIRHSTKPSGGEQRDYRFDQSTLRMPLHNTAMTCRIVDKFMESAYSPSLILGGGMLAKPEWQATARRLFGVLRDRFPDPYVTLTILVVAPLAFGAFLMALMIRPTHPFVP